MRVWIRFQIGWLLVLVLTVSALAQTTDSRRHHPNASQLRNNRRRNRRGRPDRTPQRIPLKAKTPASQNKPPATVKKKGGKAKWIVIGAVAGTAVVIGAIFAARLNNEGYF